MKCRTDCVGLGEEDASGGDGGSARGFCRRLEGEARRRSIAAVVKKWARGGEFTWKVMLNRFENHAEIREKVIISQMTLNHIFFQSTFTSV